MQQITIFCPWSRIDGRPVIGLSLQGAKLHLALVASKETNSHQFALLLNQLRRILHKSELNRVLLWHINLPLWQAHLTFLLRMQQLASPRELALPNNSTDSNQYRSSQQLEKGCLGVSPSHRCFPKQGMKRLRHLAL